MRSHTQLTATYPPILYDKLLIVIVSCIIGFGLLIMTSASIAISDQMYHQPFYFLFKQLFFLIAGICIGTMILRIELVWWEKFGGYLLMGVLVLLSLVLIPGIGHRINGSARWLGIGPLTFQVSELAKLVIVIYLSGYLVRRNYEIRMQFSGFLKPMLVLFTIALLLLREPDFGATAVITATTLGMMFLAGISVRYFVGLLFLALSSLAIIAISAPYRLARLTSFVNPWNKPFDSGYQLIQSLIAFGRGGWFGVGLGESIQKMFYLPEAHSDFLFAVIAEEFGLMGMLLVIGLFTLLVLRIFLIGRKAQTLGLHFSGYLAYGFGLWFAIQFIVSIGVNSGLFPTKGLTLPLMSYGGSSLLVNCVMIALVLRIDHENRIHPLKIR